MSSFKRKVYEPLFAIRRWKVGTDGLQSVTANYIWPGPVIHAHVRGRPVNPHEDWLSIFAWNDRGAMTDPIIDDPFPPKSWAYGVVELRNRVSIHEYGFRAETAIVRAVIIPKVSDHLVPDLESKYHCDVHVLDHDNFIAAYNSQLPNRYRFGTLESDLENCSNWCSNFLWRTRDGAILPFGEMTDHHIRFSWRILKGRTRMPNNTIRRRVIRNEMRLRGISTSSVRGGFASRFTPVKGLEQ